jgi:hypothetical protein
MSEIQLTAKKSEKRKVCEKVSILCKPFSKILVFFRSLELTISQTFAQKSIFKNLL